MFDPGISDPLTPKAVLLRGIVVGMICFPPFRGERPTAYNAPAASWPVNDDATAAPLLHAAI